jgi:hypothetical protein
LSKYVKVEKSSLRRKSEERKKHENEKKPVANSDTHIIACHIIN